MSQYSPANNQSLPAEPPAASVITGQQIGLLGGPLYCTYKLMSAVHEANKRGLRAIYWLETHDSDFSEARSIAFINKHRKVRHLTWGLRSLGRSIGDLPVDEELLSMINIMFEELPPSLHLAKARETLLKCFTRHRSLGEATMELFTTVFKPISDRFPLEFFDPNQQSFHRFAHPFLMNEADATPIGESPHLFARVRGNRMRVFRREKNLFTTRTGRALDLSKSTLLPDLYTRSVLQDAYLGGKVYVAGESEAKYLKDLKSSYARHGVTPAEVIPRMSLTLLLPEHVREIKELELTTDDLITHPPAVLEQRLIEKHSGIRLKQEEDNLTSMKEEVLTKLQKLGQAGAAKHPLFRKRLKESEIALYRARRHFVGMLRHTLKAETSAKRNILEGLTYALRPLGGKQERILNWFPVWAVQGDGFLEKLIAQAEKDEKTLVLDALANEDMR